jgi:hypothetical protein
MMNRILASALLLGAISGFGLVGCGEKTAEVTDKHEVTTPTGTSTVETTQKIKSNEPAEKNPVTPEPAK